MQKFIDFMNNVAVQEIPPHSFEKNCKTLNITNLSPENFLSIARHDDIRRFCYDICNIVKNPKLCVAYLLGRRDALLGRSCVPPFELAFEADAGPIDVRLIIGYEGVIRQSGWMDQVLENNTGVLNEPDGLSKNYPNWRVMVSTKDFVSP